MRHDAITIIGCGNTTRGHIRHLTEGVAPLTPRAIPECPGALRLSSLEPLAREVAA